jgi:protein TonB
MKMIAMKNQPNIKPGLEQKKKPYFFVGFTAACSIALAAFSWTNYHFAEYEDLGEYDAETLTLEVDELPVYRPDKPQPQKVNSFTTKFVVVPDPIEPDPDPDPTPDPVFEPILDFGDDFGDEVDDFKLFDDAGNVTDFMKVEKKPFCTDCAYLSSENERAQCTALFIKRFVSSKAIYPKSCVEAGITGEVRVGFVIDKTGKITNIEITRGVHKLLDKAAMDAVAQLPLFEPGAQQGRKVAVRFEIPVNFKLQ